MYVNLKKKQSQKQIPKFNVGSLQRICTVNSRKDIFKASKFNIM